MKILFRVDSGSHVGSGHVIRCLNLAINLRRQKFDIHFVCRNHKNNISSYIKENGFDVTELASSDDNIEPTDSNKWLGVSQLDELNELNDLIGRFSDVELLIIDHYSINRSLEEKIKVKRIMVIDDIHRSHSADILLDQNLSARVDRYKDKNIFSEAKYLCGPTYALLNSKFSDIRSEVIISSSCKRILIYFGATDLSRESLKVAHAALLEECSARYEMKFILSDKHQDYDSLLEISEQNDKINLVSFSNDMANEMFNCDICFGASGSTSWERISLMKPSVVITSADNQREISESLRDLNLIKYLGSGFKSSVKDWQKIIRNLDLDYNDYKKMALKGKDYCDGAGARRVARVIDEYINCN